MAVRFRRTVKIMPGVHLNVGKRGPSVTIGGKAGRITKGVSGTRVGSSLPGTGLYYSKKVGTSGATRAPAARVASSAREMQGGTLYDLVRVIPPKEPGTSGLVASVVGSRKLKALQAIAAALTQLSPESDAAVESAVSLAPDSWTVRREAGLYFVKRKDAQRGLVHLAEAARLFPGTRMLYCLLAADAAIDAGKQDWAVAALEPYVPRCDPESGLDGLVIISLANAHLKSGDATRALELLGRLPLRKRNLTDTLLYALCVKACANRKLGNKAQAKKDIDRVYAADPGFPTLAEATKEALAD